MPRNPSAVPRDVRLGSIQTAAERYQVHPDTIRRRIADGTLTAWRVGTAVRIDLDEADRKLLRRIPTTGGAA